MIRFWKFNAFVGTVGFVLLLTAFYVGDYSVHTYPLSDMPRNFASHSITLVTNDRSSYFGLVGGTCVAWQAVMTVLGLLVGFFRAPSR